MTDEKPNKFQAAVAAVEEAAAAGTQLLGLLADMHMAIKRLQGENQALRSELEKARAKPKRKTAAKK